MSPGAAWRLRFRVRRAEEGVDERFRIAVERLGRVTVEESVRAFEDVLAVDESYAPAYAEIAKLYMALNTPLDRQRAEKMVRQAIRLDRDNPTYQVLLGDLMWQQGFLSNAKGKYEEVLAGNPQDARGEPSGLDVYYTKDYLKYLNMIDMEGGSAMSVPDMAAIFSNGSHAALELDRRRGERPSNAAEVAAFRRGIS